MTTANHLFRPAHGAWSYWRWVCLRGSGFDVSLVCELASPGAGSAADEVLGAQAAVAAAQGTLEELLRNAARTATGDALAAVRRARKRTSKGRCPGESDVPEACRPALVALQAAHERARQARADFDEAFAVARTNVSRTLRRIAADNRFREAVTWQNRTAVVTALDELLRTPADGPLRSHVRQHEEVVANYLHRYTTKNDTIGFFGPVGWARVETGARAIELKAGPDLVASRQTHFEQWAIDALANVLATDENVLRAQTPYRYGFVRLEGDLAHTPLAAPQRLTAIERTVLLACEGDRTATAIAERFARSAPGDFANEEAVYALLRSLRERKLLGWGLESRTMWRPADELRARLGRVPDGPARARALGALDELERARERVAGAAGNADALGAALAELESTFTRITGKPPARHAGAMYAGRGIVFEDCRRDSEVLLGPEFFERVGPPLDLLLSSLRWFTSETARAYRAAFATVHEELARAAGSPRVSFSDFWFRAQRLLHGAKGRPIDDVVHSLQERWAKILGLSEKPARLDVAVSTVRDQVAQAFPENGPGWASAYGHSPDLMIGAASVDAIARGEWTAVLGEVHAAANTLEPWLFFAQHPAPNELLAALDADLPRPRVLDVRPKTSPRLSTSRGARALLTERDYELEAGFDASTLPRDRVLRLGELVVDEHGGQLVVRTLDGGFSMDLVELMGPSIAEVAVTSCRVLPELRHMPRVSLDGLVIQREAWTFEPGDLLVAGNDGEAARYLAARRWARERGLPRCVFVRSSLEVKPIFVDFDSPIAVALLAKLLRKVNEHVGGARVTVSEMLPTLDQSWLTDRAGHRFTSELRMVAVRE